MVGGALTHPLTRMVLTCHASPKTKRHLAGRPKAFRTSGGIAADFLGKSYVTRDRRSAVAPSCRH